MQVPTERGQSLAGAGEAEALDGLPALAVVSDLEIDRIRLEGEPDVDARRPGRMPMRVGESLLGHAIEGRLRGCRHVDRRALDSEVDRQIALTIGGDEMVQRIAQCVVGKGCRPAIYATFGQLTHEALGLSAQNLSTAPVVVAADGTMLSATHASEVCRQLGSSCIGELQWTAMSKADDGTLSPPQGDGSKVWVLHPTNDAVLDALVLNPEIDYPDNGFRNLMFRAWNDVVDEGHEPIYGGLVAIAEGTDTSSLGVGYIAMPARDWLATEAPSRLLVGPTGSDNKEIIPACIFLLLGATSVVFGVTMVRQNHLVAALDDLGALGVRPGTRRLIRAVVNLVPAVFAIIGAYLTCVAAASVVPTAIHGAFEIVWTPPVPPVIAIALGLMAVVAAFLPTIIPVHRRH